MNRSTQIPASGAPVAIPLGPFKYLAIRTATVSFQISFDGWNWIPAKQNDRFDKSNASPLYERIYFQALNGLASNVVFEYDKTPIGSQDTAQSVVINSATGTGGSKVSVTVKEARTAANAQYDFLGATPVDLTKNNILFIPGIQNGLKRKEIVFDNRSGLADVIVFAPDGSICFRIAPADAPRSLETSSDFYVGGNKGDSAGFIYTELFYSNANA